MKFEDFITEGKVKRAAKDIAMAKALLRNALDELKYIDDLEVSDASASILMRNYYDILRRILEAIASLEGYMIYSHEAFTYFLRERGEGIISAKFDRFRKIRNGISYYGQTISAEEAGANVEEMKNMINTLIEKYLKSLAN